MKRAKTADQYFAQPDQWREELKRLREIILSQQLVETIKWGCPCYTFDGKNVVCVVSFKQYFGLWFYDGALLDDKNDVLINAQEGKTKALRQWRMTSAKNIKPTVVKRYLKEAIQLVRDGKRIAPAKKKRLVVPSELNDAFRKNTAAKAAFAALKPGLRREYADYVASAKREETRNRRVLKVLPMIEAGEGLNDKYR